MRFAYTVALTASALAAGMGCDTETTLISPEAVLGSAAGGWAQPAPLLSDASAWEALSWPVGSKATLGVFETSDLHANVLSYDYFKLAEDRTVGLERTATLIQDARIEFPNNLLIDNGDTIQGSVLADYEAQVQPVACDTPLSIYKAMNQLKYDVGGIGNHEFNYGLPFLSQVTHTPFDVEGLDTEANTACAGAKFPQVNSNVFSAQTDQPLYAPSALITRNIIAMAPDGRELQVELKVGVIGFTPPQILSWDKASLDGKLKTKGVQEVAGPLVEELRSRGADLVMAIVHGGLDDSEYSPALENQAWHMAQVPGIDALLMGHSHQLFPAADSQVRQFDLPMVDKARGTVAGVPAVMPGAFGQALGVIKLELRWDGRRWVSEPGLAVAEARPITTLCTDHMPVACDIGERWASGAPCVFATRCSDQPDGTRITLEADSEIAGLVESAHNGTIAYVKKPVGESDFELSTHFADVGDPSALQVVNQAQAAYVEDYVRENLPEYASLPVISVSAPFKSGFAGASDYTDVKAGPLAINNAADLYLYPNTVVAVKVSGAELRAWLETAATRFTRIDPSRSEPQNLINPEVPGYLFDVITDPRITYEIDVTQPASSRIVNLTFEGEPLDPAREFIVATNNYRASGGGNFPGLDGSKTVWAAPDANRDVLIAYIQNAAKLTRVDNAEARSWRFSKTAVMGPVTFTSAQDALPQATAAGLANISVLQQDDGSGKGLSVYAIDLSQ